jgi:hypothetical protein
VPLFLTLMLLVAFVYNFLENEISMIEEERILERHKKSVIRQFVDINLVLMNEAR